MKQIINNALDKIKSFISINNNDLQNLLDKFSKFNELIKKLK